MLKIKLTSIVLALHILPTVAHAQSICDTVLLQRAFDTQSISESSDIAEQRRNEICSSEFSDVGEARSKARSAGFSLGYGGVSIGLNGSRGSENSDWNIQETEFCSADAESIRSSYGSNFETVVARVAVTAWSECVTTTTADDLFVSYETSSDGTIISGNMYFRVGGSGPLERFITGMVLPRREREAVVCNIGGQDLTASSIPEAGFRIEDSGLAFVCEIDALERNFSLSFQTNSGPSIALNFQSPETQQQIAMQGLDNRITALSESLIPSGSIIAFTSTPDEVSCPDGYTLMPESDGRFLVGADLTSGERTGFNLAPLNQGGSTEILIQTPNLPPHTHDYSQRGLGPSRHHDRFDGWKISTPGGDYYQGEILLNRNTSPNETDHAPVAHLPPYLAVNFCQRD